MRVSKLQSVPRPSFEVSRERVPVLPPFIALVELFVLCGAIMLADWLFTSIDISEIHPNPYWVPVLLLTLQYGAVSGMLAAVISSIATIYGGFPEQGVGENYFVYFLRVWALPIVWLGVAILIGQFRTRQIALKQGLRNGIVEISSQRAALAEHVSNLRRRCEALERELAGREDRGSAPMLLDALSRLADGREAASALADLAHVALPGVSLALYAPRGQMYVLQAGVSGDGGPASDDRLRAEIARSDRLISTLATRDVSVLDAGGEALLAGRGIAAAAARDARGQAALVLLAVDGPGDMVRPELLDRMRVVARLLAALAPADATPSDPSGHPQVVADQDPPNSHAGQWGQRRWIRDPRRPAAGRGAAQTVGAPAAARGRDV